MGGGEQRRQRHQGDHIFPPALPCTRGPDHPHSCIGPLRQSFREVGNDELQAKKGGGCLWQPPFKPASGYTMRPDASS